MNPKPRNEDELLELEACYAEQGISRALREAGHDVLDAINPRKQLREHPLATIGVAAGAAVGVGFTVRRLLPFLRQRPDSTRRIGRIAAISAATIARNPATRRALVGMFSMFGAKRSPLLRSLLRRYAGQGSTEFKNSNFNWFGATHAGRSHVNGVSRKHTSFDTESKAPTPGTSTQRPVGS
jgi:hypothetical protein